MTHIIFMAHIVTHVMTRIMSHIVTALQNHAIDKHVTNIYQ